MNDPKDIFNKFSPNARKILISSQKIASGMGNAMSSEHILLGLAVTPQTLAHGILREHLVGMDQIKLVISLQKIPGTPNAGISHEGKKILELAAQAALEFGHNQIDSEHLLLAICSSKNYAADIINRIGADCVNIRDQILNFFDDLKEFESKAPQLPINQMRDLNQLPEEIFPPMNFPEPPIPPAKKLENFTTDLTALAEKVKIDPVIGREREIQRVIQILCRRQKNNPVLVGEPGVGKTAIVEGLAQRIVKGQVPTQIANKRLVMLDLALLVAGTMYRGQFEERIKKVLDELLKKENTILFIDEIHTIVGAGSAEGSLDLANILKPSLAKGKLRLIGATTYDEYRKFIEKDPALERRLQKVNVEEPSTVEAVSILKGVKTNYEIHHGVKISDEAIEAAVNLSKRFVSDRFLPDKAIDLIDEASSAWQISHPNVLANHLKDTKKELAQIIQQKEADVEAQNFQKAAEFRAREIQLKDRIAKIEKKQKLNKVSNEIGREDIARVLALWTNVPVETLRTEEKFKFLRLGDNLKKNIIGQDDAVKEIASAIKRSKTGISEPNRPIGSFVFLGPTGVGKTELAKVLAQELFGSKDALIKIDMSEFMERHNVSRLLGAPPGYVGYDDAGKLTEKVRQKPYSIILFDEIEKAHPEVLNILLQIMEDGEVTDSRGRRINFRNTIIIMTSNIGIHELNQQAVIGFTARANKKKTFFGQYDKMKDQIIKKLKDQFKPELLNRIDKIIVFKPLSQKEIEKIAQLQLNKLAERLTNEKITVSFDKAVIELIAKSGFDANYGARPVRRAIADLIEGPLSEQILANQVRPRDSVKISIENDKINFKHLKNNSKVV